MKITFTSVPGGLINTLDLLEICTRISWGEASICEVSCSVKRYIGGYHHVSNFNSGDVGCLGRGGGGVEVP